MKLTLKKIFFESKDKSKNFAQRYKAHSFLNIGQAIHDIKNLKSFPDAKTEKESIANRAKSIALNLFYAVVDPTTHHGDEIEEMDRHVPDKWLKIGAEELSLEENKKHFIKENIDKELKDVPKNVDNHLPPYVKMGLSDDEFNDLEKNLAAAIEKMPISKEKIILTLLATIEQMKK